MTIVDAVPPQVLVSAHRGGPKSSSSKENSLEAFSRAAAAGVDFIEFDVHATKDGHFVVSHSPKVQLGWRRRRIADVSLAAIEAAGVDLPSLSDVCNVVCSPVVAHIDVKFRADEALLLTLATLSRFLLGDGRYVFTSRDTKVTQILARWCEQEGIDNCVGLSIFLPLGRVPSRRWYNFGAMLPASRFHASGAGFIVAHHSIARAGVLAWAATNHVRVLVWTVDSDRVLRHLMSDQRVWALTSNDPVRALGYRTTSPISTVPR